MRSPAAVEANHVQGAFGPPVCSECHTNHSRLRMLPSRLLSLQLEQLRENRRLEPALGHSVQALRISRQLGHILAETVSHLVFTMASLIFVFRIHCGVGWYHQLWTVEAVASRYSRSSNYAARSVENESSGSSRRGLYVTFDTLLFVSGIMEFEGAGFELHYLQLNFQIFFSPVEKGREKKKSQLSLDMVLLPTSFTEQYTW